MSSQRILRPSLSSRYRYLQLCNSTRSSSTTSTPLQNASFLRRNRSRIVWATTGLAIGVICGNFIVHTVSPPALPDAGTHGDKVLLADLTTRIDDVFTVKVLRGKCLSVSRQLKGKQGAWVELVKREDDGSTQDDGLRSSIAGAKGMGVERLFWNSEDEKLVAVVYFGGSLSGWPGVTHGGIIATQMVEKIGLAAALMHGSHKHVSAAAVPQRMPGTGKHAKMFLPSGELPEPETLSLSYVKPTYANDFYIIRVSPNLGLEEDAQPATRSANNKHTYEAILENMESRILVKARAIVEVSALEQLERKTEEAVRWTYNQFQQWMWPSRQDLIQRQ